MQKSRTRQDGHNVPMELFCTGCGRADTQTGHFCSSCGTPSALRTVVEQAIPRARTQPLAVTSASSDAGRLALGIGAGLLAFGMAAGGFWVLKNMSAEASQRALESQVVANRGRIENAWAVGVGAHGTFIAQLRQASKNNLAPYASSAQKMASELDSEVATFKNTVPDYGKNPPLEAVVDGLQAEAVFYHKLPVLFAQKHWDVPQGLLLAERLRAAEGAFRKVEQQVPGLSPPLTSEFADLSPVQQQLEHQEQIKQQTDDIASKSRLERVAYMRDFESVMTRYNNTRDDMQRFANQIRTGYVNRNDAITEFRKAQAARMALRDELGRLQPPPALMGIQADLAGCMTDSLRAIDAAIQAIVASASDQSFDAHLYWSQFVNDSNGISERMATLDSRFKRLGGSL
jgi:hypothetical protein